MGGLRKFVDKIKPTFSEGGKLSFLASTFDAFETFLFVPNTTTSRGAHIRDCNDMKRTMIVVVVALMPALLFGMYNTGYQVGMTGWAAFWFGFLEVLPMIVVSYVVGLGIEFFFAQKRGHEVNEGFLVSGLLIPMIMPVGTPLWMIALGTAFAVIFGKEVFGGTGMNVFNPALLARAFAFFAWLGTVSAVSSLCKINGRFLTSNVHRLIQTLVGFFSCCANTFLVIITIFGVNINSITRCKRHGRHERQHHDKRQHYRKCFFH